MPAALQHLDRDLTALRSWNTPTIWTCAVLAHGMTSADRLVFLCSLPRMSRVIDRVPPYVGASRRDCRCAACRPSELSGHAATQLLWVRLRAGRLSSEPEPARRSPAVPLDRPLDAAATGDRVSVRTAALLEAALAQVGAAELRRCMADFAGDAPPRFRATGAWRLADRGLRPAGRRRRVRRPQRGGTRAQPAACRRLAGSGHLPGAAALGATRADGAVACLSCVVRLRRRPATYRHAYALDTCQRGAPGERTLATVGWPCLERLQSSRRTVSSSPSASP